VDTIADAGTASGFGAGSGTISLSNGNPGTTIFNGTGQTNRPFRAIENTNGGTPAVVVTTGNSVTLSGGITLSGTVASSRPLTVQVDGTGMLSETGSIVGTQTLLTLTKTGAGTFTMAGSNTYVGVTTVSAGTLIAANGDCFGGTPSVTVSASANMKIPTGVAKAVKITSLTANGTVDLNSAMLVNGGATFTDIRNKIITGYASQAWTGPGINSSSAAAVFADGSNPHKTAIGYAQGPAIIGATYQGQTVDANSVVASYVYYGDANLDKTVDTIDFNLLAFNFSQTGKFWVDGDFDYNGTVDTIDFNLLASNFSLVLAGQNGASGIGTLVPEPGTIGVVLLCGAGMMARRRRN
jgi:autotransporter-associated beta strand protein